MKPPRGRAGCSGSAPAMVGRGRAEPAEPAETSGSMYDLFEGIERVQCRLYYDATQMARSFTSFSRDMKRLAERHSGQFFEREVSDANGTRIYRIPILPAADKDPRWFIVEIYPPPGHEDGEEPVELLFKLHDFYLLGLFGDKKLYLFSDADTTGMSINFVTKHVERLKFGGGYGPLEQDYVSLIIGFTGQVETYRIFSKFAKDSEAFLREDNSDPALRKALCRAIITISEAIRFPQLTERLIAAFKGGEFEKTLDVEVPKGEGYKNLTFHFTKWSTYCRVMQEGKHKFVEKKIDKWFPEYDSLFSFVGVMLFSQTDYENLREI